MLWLYGDKCGLGSLVDLIYAVALRARREDICNNINFLINLFY